MSNRQVTVGEMVYWYNSLAPHARPWPAMVLAVNAGTARREAGQDLPPIPVLDLNVHQPNRLMHRQSTFHRSEPQLKRWPIQDVEMLGCWQTIAEAEQAKSAAEAAIAAVAAENQRALQEQEAARQLEEEARAQAEAKRLEESQRSDNATTKPTPAKAKSSSAV